MLEPPLGAIENAEPGTAWVWSRFSDQVTVTVMPSAATVAELIVGAVVSTRKERIALKEELAADESTSFARQEQELPRPSLYPAGTAAAPFSLTDRLVPVESKVPSELE